MDVRQNQGLVAIPTTKVVALVILINWTLELLGGWVVTFGIGRASSESDADGQTGVFEGGNTGGTHERADGPYSTDFRQEEPLYYEEDRAFGFH